jgi:hypothetical protein
MLTIEQKAKRYDQLVGLIWDEINHRAEIAVCDEEEYRDMEEEAALDRAFEDKMEEVADDARGVGDDSIPNLGYLIEAICHDEWGMDVFKVKNGGNPYVPEYQKREAGYAWKEAIEAIDRAKAALNPTPSSMMDEMISSVLFPKAVAK